MSDTNVGIYQNARKYFKMKVHLLMYAISIFFLPAGLSTSVYFIPIYCSHNPQKNNHNNKNNLIQFLPGIKKHQYLSHYAQVFRCTLFVLYFIYVGKDTYIHFKLSLNQKSMSVL